jgi:hypothetical protein
MDGEAVSLPKSDFTMTTGDEPGTVGAGQGPVGPVGPSGPAGITEKLPGPLKSSNLFLLTALILALVAGVVVATGDIGWTQSERVLNPIYPEEVPVDSHIKHNLKYNASDGGMYAAGVAIIALLLFLAGVMAFLAIMRARSKQSRLLLLGGIGLAVGALVASILASVTFNSWAEDENFKDWGTGSSVWGGMVGSILLIVLFAVPMRLAGPIKADRPLPQSQYPPEQPPPHYQPTQPSPQYPPTQPPPQYQPAQPPPQYPQAQSPPQYAPAQPPPQGAQQPQQYQQRPQQRIPPRYPPQ